MDTLLLPLLGTLHHPEFQIMRKGKHLVEAVAFFLTLASDPLSTDKSVNHFNEVSPFPTEVLNLVSLKA